MSGISEATTIQDLSGRNAYLFRFHADPNYIPGDVLSNCTVIEIQPGEGEVAAWGGRRGPTTRDRKDIAYFCQDKGFVYVYWWRYKNGKEPRQVVLYDVRANG